MQILSGIYQIFHQLVWGFVLINKQRSLSCVLHCDKTQWSCENTRDRNIAVKICRLEYFLHFSSVLKCPECLNLSQCNTRLKFLHLVYDIEVRYQMKILAYLKNSMMYLLPFQVINQCLMEGKLFPLLSVNLGIVTQHSQCSGRYSMYGFFNSLTDCVVHLLLLNASATQPFSCSW